jgi:hypothetical protein
MLAGSIADSKLLQITTAGKVATSCINNLFTLGTTAFTIFQTVSTMLNGVNPSTSFVGALTGNASTAQLWQQVGEFLEQVTVYYRCFDGTGNVQVLKHSNSPCK